MVEGAAVCGREEQLAHHGDTEARRRQGEKSLLWSADSHGLARAALQRCVVCVRKKRLQPLWKVAQGLKPPCAAAAVAGLKACSATTPE